MTIPVRKYDAVTHREIPNDTPKFVFSYPPILARNLIDNASSSTSSYPLPIRAEIIPNEEEIEIEQEWLELPPERSLENSQKANLLLLVRAINLRGRTGNTDIVSDIKIHPKTLNLFLKNVSDDAPILSTVKRIIFMQENLRETYYTVTGLEKFKNLIHLRFSTCNIGLAIDINKSPSLKRILFDDLSYLNLIPEEDTRTQLAEDKIVHTSYRTHIVEDEDVPEHAMEYSFFHKVINLDAFYLRVIFPILASDIKNAAE